MHERHVEVKAAWKTRKFSWEQTSFLCLAAYSVRHVYAYLCMASIDAILLAPLALPVAVAFPVLTLTLAVAVPVPLLLRPANVHAVTQGSPMCEVPFDCYQTADLLTVYTVQHPERATVSWGRERLQSPTQGTATKDMAGQRISLQYDRSTNIHMVMMCYPHTAQSLG